MAENITDKIGEGAWTLYLYECPKCHCRRKLDKEKLATCGALTAVGFGGSMLLGAPIAGWFGAIGITQLVTAGTISASLAAQLIRANYNLLVKMSERSLFSCPMCGCTDLVDMTAISTLTLQTRKAIGPTIAEKAAAICDKAGSAMDKGAAIVGEQCSQIADSVSRYTPVVLETAKSTAKEIGRDIERGFNEVGRHIDKGISNISKWWRSL